jgi:hypothetical protein
MTRFQYKGHEVFIAVESKRFRGGFVCRINGKVAGVALHPETLVDEAKRLIDAEEGK